ncbi:MAG: uracil-DNA glycosylase, partial [Candidatus Gracilibacteria bacterium]|nr:uracil-DNA glycosylase [Candidatus Gracilibacteria bacterium]
MFDLNGIDNKWEKIINKEFGKEYFENITNFLENEYKNNKIIYPKKDDILNAFRLCSLDDLKIVILGQDPYHGKNQANGLSFSIKNGNKIPPSLKNIYKELNNDLGIEISNNGDLSLWAKQGVLLLNTTLTVEEKKPNSHSKIGWQFFTDNIIKEINLNKKNIIFILWGDFAQKKENLIDNSKHFIIKSSHPSPFSAHRGFFGSKVFSQTNNILTKLGKKNIDWNINKNL